MRRLAWALVVALLLAASLAEAQRGFRGGRGRFGSESGAPPKFATATDFDGKFHICRLMYQQVRQQNLGMGWGTDYPLAEINLSIRLSELTKTTVSFDGARDGRVGGLRKAVELEEGAPISEALVERAALLVSAFYFDNGFLNVKVATPARDRAKDGTVRVSFKITEGPVFKIGKIRASKVGGDLEKEILAKVTTKPGEVFRRSKLKSDLDAVRAMFQARGEKVDVDPSTELDPKRAVVDIDLVVTKR